MTTQTLEQKRAQHALGKINSLKGKPGKYVRYVNGLPAAILMNGLGQAVATERAAAKNDQAHRNLATHVSDWLLSGESGTKYPNPDGSNAANPDPSLTLLTRMVAGDQHAYLWAQAEAIAYVTWLKKFANAFLEPTEKE